MVVEQRTWPFDRTLRIAEWAVLLDRSLIDADVVALTRLCLQDALACMIAGSREDSATLSRDALAPHSVGHAEIVGASMGAASVDAALLNGIAAHALDFDDVFVGAIPVHASAVVVPAVLAIAQERNLSGAELIDAIALGEEAAARLATMLPSQHYTSGFHATGTVGSLAAAVGVGRALRLDVRSMTFALGLASTTAGGLKGSFGSMAKHLNAGAAAANAVRAGLLAERGFTAMPDALDGPQGFSEVLAGAEVGDFETSGDDWLMTRTLFKTHASCAATHAAIDAIASIRSQIPIDTVDRIILTVPRSHLDVCAIPAPRDSMQAKFSLAFTSALTLAGHSALPDNFSIERLRDPRIVKLMQTVEIRVDDTLAPLGTVVRVGDVSGFEWSASCDSLSSSSAGPDLADRLARKFTGLVSPVVGGDETVALFDRIHALDGAGQARGLIKSRGHGCAARHI